MDSQIGPYKIIREIAQDDIGPTFEAVDQTRNKRVSLKYLQATASSEILPRLASEARTLALLNHPYIARLFGSVRRGKHLYLIMEFVAGQTLENILKQEGRFRPDAALILFHQIMSGVEFAHGLGVIHGNLKPSNIVVTNLGLIKILDFAIAHILGNSERVGSRASTVCYRSPEQMRGEPLDARSDIYSLGLLLYEMIVGKQPFDIYAQSDEVRVEAELIPIAPSLFVPDSPKWLDDFLVQALAPSPSQRFQSVKVMAQAIIAPVSPNAGTILGKHERALRRRSANWIAASSNTALKARNGAVKLMMAIAGSPAIAARALGNIAKTSAEHMVTCQRKMVYSVSSGYNVLLLAQNRLLESYKKTLSICPKIDWKRYASTVCFLLFVSLEVFYFHGANLSLLLDSEFLSKPSLNDAVDAMFTRLDRKVLTNDRRGIDSKELPPAIERKESPLVTQTSRAATVSAPSGSAKSQQSIRPSPLRRNGSDSIALRSEKQTNLPFTDVSIKKVNLNEPVVASTTAQNNRSKSQLNVQWEN